MKQGKKLSFLDQIINTLEILKNHLKIAESKKSNYANGQARMLRLAIDFVNDDIKSFKKTNKFLNDENDFKSLIENSAEIIEREMFADIVGEGELIKGYQDAGRFASSLLKKDLES